MGRKLFLNHLIYDTIENQILIEWLTNTLSVRLNVPPPIAHPLPAPRFTRLLYLLMHLLQLFPTLEASGALSPFCLNKGGE